MLVKSICGAVNILAAITGKDVLKLYDLYDLPYKSCPRCGCYVPSYKIYCSVKCFSASKRILVACSYCGKLHERLASQVIYWRNHNKMKTGKTQDLFFCTKKCNGKWLANGYGFEKFPGHGNYRGKRVHDYDTILQLLKEGASISKVSMSLNIPYGSAKDICTKLRKEHVLPKIKGGRPRIIEDEISN